MTLSTPAGIQLHSCTGRKHWFYQGDPLAVLKICEDLEHRIFSRGSLVIEGKDEVTAFPSESLLGITVLIDPLPESLLAHEQASGTVITQMSHEVFQYRRLQYMANAVDRQGSRLSEIEFVSGERLFVEIDERAVRGDSERSILSHLFTRPAIYCRRLDGGFGIWNTRQIVSWSHYPKLEAPESAWKAEKFYLPALDIEALAKTI